MAQNDEAPVDSGGINESTKQRPAKTVEEIFRATRSLNSELDSEINRESIAMTSLFQNVGLVTTFSAAILIFLLGSNQDGVLWGIAIAIEASSVVCGIATLLMLPGVPSGIGMDDVVNYFNDGDYEAMDSTIINRGKDMLSVVSKVSATLGTVWTGQCVLAVAGVPLCIMGALI